MKTKNILMMSVAVCILSASLISSNELIEQGQTLLKQDNTQPNVVINVAPASDKQSTDKKLAVTLKFLEKTINLIGPYALAYLIVRQLPIVGDATKAVETISKYSDDTFIAQFAAALSKGMRLR